MLSGPILDLYTFAAGKRKKNKKTKSLPDKKPLP
jgi:hypothetical protein